MSLSEGVRGELAAIQPRKACCRLAELSALVRSGGSVHLRGGGRIALHVEVASPAVARRAFSLLRSYGVHCEIRTYRQRAFERATRYQLHMDDDARALQVLNEAGVLDVNLAPLGRPPRRVVARSCCRAAYLRGALLAAGSVSGPRNAHLELRAADEEGARFLAGLAQSEGFPVAAYERGRHALAYAKGVETIADLLAFLGAHEAALRLGEGAVVAATRARANRLANADHANIVRASRAADAQLRAIRRLEQKGRLEELSPELREIARLRSRHPTLPLRELARRCRPPATKAAAHRRLAKLQRLAER
ncbi:MAG: DNA-binding protein WhiA [Gaiellaceae bacterium]